MRDLLFAFYLFLPAGIANTIPPILTRLLGAGRPIDAGRTWRGQPILGSHKTWQGLIGGTIAGAITFAVQRFVDDFDVPLALAVLMPFGALCGDLLKSFFKRQMAIAPGTSWFPIDQLDYVFGALAVTVPVMWLPWRIVLYTIVVYFVLHVIVSAIGYAIGFKDELL